MKIFKSYSPSVALILLFSSLNSFAQNTFERLYSSYHDEWFTDGIVMKDSTIVHIGNQKIHADTSTRSFFIKTNRFGDTLWTRSVYDTSKVQLECGTESSDNGIVAAGLINEDFYILKLNSAGHVKWRKAIVCPGKQYLSKIISCKDKGFLLCGMTDSQKAYLVKTDSVANVIWAKVFTVTGVNIYKAVWIKSVAELPNGDFFALGWGALQQIGGVMISRLSSTGNLQWARLIQGTNGDAFAVSSNREIYVAGRSINYNYITLLMADSLGNPHWVKKYTYDETPVSLQITKDQSLLLCTEMSWFRDIGLSKFTLTGTPIWAKIYGIPNIDYVKKAIECPDGGIVMIANRMHISGNHDLLVLKTDTLGKNCVYDVNILKVDTPQISVAPFSFTATSAGTTISLPYSVSGGATLQTLCSYNPPPVITDLNKISTSNKLRIFPNPASTELNFEIEEGMLMRIEIITLLGEIKNQIYLRENRVQISCSSLEEGYYIARIYTDDNRVISYPLIIAR